MSQPEKKLRSSTTTEEAKTDQTKKLSVDELSVVLEKLDIKDAVNFAVTQRRIVEEQQFDAIFRRLFTLVLDATNPDPQQRSPLVQACLGQRLLDDDLVGYLSGVSNWVHSVRFRRVQRPWTWDGWKRIMHIVSKFPHLTALEFEHCDVQFLLDSQQTFPRAPEVWEPIQWNKMRVFTVVSLEQICQIHSDCRWIPFHPESKQEFGQLQVLKLTVSPPGPHGASLDDLLARIPNLGNLQIFEVGGAWIWTLATLETLRTKAKSLSSLVLIHIHHGANDEIDSPHGLNHLTIARLLETCPLLAKMTLGWDRDASTDDRFSYKMTWDRLSSSLACSGTNHPLVLAMLRNSSLKTLSLRTSRLDRSLPRMGTVLEKLGLSASTTRLKLTSPHMYNADLVEYVWKTFLPANPNLQELELHSSANPDDFYWKVGLHPETKSFDLELGHRRIATYAKTVETLERILTSASRAGHTKIGHLRLPLPYIGLGPEQDRQIDQRLVELIRRFRVSKFEVAPAKQETRYILRLAWLELLGSVLEEFDGGDVDNYASFDWELSNKKTLGLERDLAKTLGTPACTLRKLRIRMSLTRETFAMLAQVQGLEHLTISEGVIDDHLSLDLFHKVCRRNSKLTGLRLDVPMEWKADWTSFLPEMVNLNHLSLELDAKGVLYQDLLVIQRTCPKLESLVLSFETDDDVESIPALPPSWEKWTSKDVAFQQRFPWPIPNLSITILDRRRQDLTHDLVRLPLYLESHGVAAAGIDQDSKKLPAGRSATTAKFQVQTNQEAERWIDDEILRRIVQTSKLTPEQVDLRRAIQERTEFKSSRLAYTYNPTTKTHEFRFSRSVLSGQSAVAKQRLTNLVRGLVLPGEDFRIFYVLFYRR